MSFKRLVEDVVMTLGLWAIHSTLKYAVGNLDGVNRRMFRSSRETGEENNPTEYREAWINNSRTKISKM